MSSIYLEKYNELLSTLVTYNQLETQRIYFEVYKKQLNKPNHMLSVQLNHVIGETELRLALAKAIICQNSETMLTISN